jgi:hypothetical protein
MLPCQSESPAKIRNLLKEKATLRIVKEKLNSNCACQGRSQKQKKDIKIEWKSCIFVSEFESYGTV